MQACSIFKLFSIYLVRNTVTLGAQHSRLGIKVFVVIFENKIKLNKKRFKLTLLQLPMFAWYVI